MKIVAIIQARMGSVRFPGKMMATLVGRPIIEWVLTRVAKAKLLDEIVLATSFESKDDELCEFAEKAGVSFYRGSETDVLGRVRDAACSANATAVVRICADNPFIDSKEIDRLVRLYLDAAPDYAFNHLNKMGNGYADGFGAEILSMNLLEELAENTNELSHREHLTLAVWSRADLLEIKTIAAPKNLAFSEMCFDIDTQEDLKRLEPIAEQVGIHGAAMAFVEKMKRVEDTY